MAAGTVRLNAALAEFADKGLSGARVDEIAALPGFGRRTAVAVLAALHGAAGDPSDARAEPGPTPAIEENA